MDLNRELKGLRIDSTQLNEEIGGMERGCQNEQLVHEKYIETLNKSADQTVRGLELGECGKRVKELKGRLKRGRLEELRLKRGRLEELRLKRGRLEELKGRLKRGRLEELQGRLKRGRLEELQGRLKRGRLEELQGRLKQVSKYADPQGGLPRVDGQHAKMGE